MTNPATISHSPMNRMVNRVPTLHRPPHPDAPYQEALAYWRGWQKRHPEVDMEAMRDAAIVRVCVRLNEILGIQIDAATIIASLDSLHPEETNQ